MKSFHLRRNEKRSNMKCFTKLLLGFVMCWPTLVQSQNPKTILEKSIQSMNACKSLSGRMERAERVKGKLVKGDLFFKINLDPFKVYLYNYEPDQGAEILYVTGWNKNKALINPNKFPFVNMSFAPKSDIMLKDRHHTIYNIGFSYTAKVMAQMVQQIERSPDQVIRYEREATWSGKPCHVLSVSFPNYGFQDYIVQPGEDLIDIDEKLRVPAYKIMELNPDIRDFGDVEAGNVIRVPNNYAKKVIYFIDQQQFLPVLQMVYDDQGLFEKYDFIELNTNPTFDAGEFQPEWHEYDFK